MKQVIVFLTSMVFLGASYAQDLGFGPKLGLNFTNATINDGKNESRVLYHLGVFADIPVQAGFSVQPELLFSAQGFYQDGTLKGPATFRYILVPLLGKYEIFDGFSALFGPQVGIFLSNTFVVENTSQAGTYHFPELSSAVDIALGFGAEYKIISGLAAGLRYNLGLTDTHADDDTVSKTRVIQLYASYDIAKQILK